MRGGPIAPKNFNTLIARLGERAGMAFPSYPHLLRHACGFALANLDMTRGLSRPGSATATSNTPPDTPSCRRRGSRTSGDSEVQSLRDTLNAGYLYLEVKCLGCDTHQTVALDIVRRRKTTPIHELERYMRCREGKNRKWAVATQTGS